MCTFPRYDIKLNFFKNILTSSFRQSSQEFLLWVIVIVKLNANFFIARAVQNAIVKEILDCYECIICKETIQPAVIVSPCCESILGCERCIETWTSTHSGCPKCRSEEDFIVIKLRGFQILTKLNSSFNRVGWRKMKTRKHWCSCV